MSENTSSENSNEKIKKETNDSVLENNNDTQKNTSKEVINEVKLEQSEESSHKCSCKSNGNENSMNGGEYVLAIGRVSWNYPNTSLKMEAAHSMNAEGIKDKNEPDRLYKLLKNREYRHIARELCWTLKVNNVDVYLIHPVDPFEYDTLIETINTPDVNIFELEGEAARVINVLIGTKGPIATCGSFGLPVLLLDDIKIIAVDDLRQSLMNSDKVKKKINELNVKPEEFKRHIDTIWNKLAITTENEGATDELRAINHAMLRSDSAFIASAEQEIRNDLTLVSIVPTPVKINGIEKSVDIIFNFRSDEGFIERNMKLTVNVTGKYPFVVAPLREVITALGPY